jgi:peroxiredoxin Q/BCP
MLKFALLGLVAVCAVGVFSAELAQVAKVGELLPEVSATDHNGATVKLNDFKDKTGVVVFFIPKAFTPGCTKESCGFRDESAKYKEKGYTIFGASRDDVATLKKFVDEYKLPYSYLSDPKGELAATLGIAPGKRESIVIGKDGKVEKIIKGVNAGTHFTDLLKDMK